MADNKAKGRQSHKKKGYYDRQYYKTANNKIRRLRKRVSFDPTAGPAIKKLQGG